MEPGIYNGTISQGGDETLDFEWADENQVPVNMTGWSGEYAIREFDRSPNKLISLTVANGGMTLGNGTIRVVVPSLNSKVLNFNKVYFTLRITDTSGQDYPLLCGELIVNRGFQ